MQQLKQAIHEAGYTVAEIHREFENHYPIPYDRFAKYCRAVNSSRHDREFWRKLRILLDEKGIVWEEE